MYIISCHIISYHRRKRLQISCYHATFCLGTEGPTHPEDDTTGSQVLSHFGWQPGRRGKSWDQSHGLKTKWIICNRYIYVLYIYLYLYISMCIYIYTYNYTYIYIYISVGICTSTCIYMQYCLHNIIILQWCIASQWHLLVHPPRRKLVNASAWLKLEGNFGYSYFRSTSNHCIIPINICNYMYVCMYI